VRVEGQTVIEVGNTLTPRIVAIDEDTFGNRRESARIPWFEWAT
jgi:hypothetical protein